MAASYKALSAIQKTVKKELTRTSIQASQRARGSLGRRGSGGMYARAFYRAASGKVFGVIGSNHPLATIFELTGRGLGRASTASQGLSATRGNLIRPGTRTPGARALFIPGIGFRAWARKSRMLPRPTIVPAFARNRRRLFHAVTRTAFKVGVTEAFGRGVRFHKKLKLFI